jgi:hypothetical protein
MTDLTTLQAQLADLRAAYATGATRISYDGKSIEYRDGNEMRAAIASLEAQIAALGGTQPVRTIVVRGHKGW